MTDAEDKLLKLITPLGQDVLLPLRIEGKEGVSQLFTFRLDMMSSVVSIDPTDIIGKTITVSLRVDDNKYRHFNGYVASLTARAPEFDTAESRSYTASIVPSFWLLKLNRNNRVFQDTTVPEIVQQICKDGGLKNVETKLKGTYSKKTYCIQYGESDFEFISRLMEEAGIFYYFTHDDKTHTAVLGDAAAAYADCEEPKLSHIAVLSDKDAEASGDEDSYITRWERQYKLIPGKYALTDYDFEAPHPPLAAHEKTIVKIEESTKRAVFEFPGGFQKGSDGKALAKVRMEGMEVRHDVANGASTCRVLGSGLKFKLQDHPVDAENNLAYVVSSVTHVATEVGVRQDTSGYSNQFQCVPAKTVLRPRRATSPPQMHGPQSAKVVGAKNQEILTDKYGRVKIQFPWDREGKYDDKSSCFVRVAQSWAGAKRGFQFTPRVGDEVLVEFMNGDPDRPIITGSVYNADNMPPWKLPDDAHISGVKTLSTDKAKAKNFSELHFDDKIGKEKIYFHAERDFVRIVENNDELKIGFDAKDKGDQTIDIYNDRTVTIDKGKDTLSIKSGDRLTNIDKGDDKVTIKTGSQVVMIKAGEQKTEAAKAITFKVGGSSIKLDPAGITIKAAKISVLADLKAEVKGTLVDIVGSGVTSVKGGLVKIN